MNGFGPEQYRSVSARERFSRQGLWISLLILVSSLVVFTPSVDANEALAQRWSVSLDNDLFAAVNQDRDYTGGFSILYLAPVPTFSDSLDRISGKLHDNLRGDGSLRFRGTEIGGFGFTPANTVLNQAQPEDRPYSSVVYLSAIEESIAAH